MLPLRLSEKQLKRFQEDFDLSYHLPYLEQCDNRVPLLGLDVLEVGGAMPASLVLGHMMCNSWTAVEAPSYDEELGEANQFHRNKQEDSLSFAGKYEHLYMNIEEIPEKYREQFDLIFTIACFEHINRLPKALATMHRCLKPGGGIIYNAFTNLERPRWPPFTHWRSRTI